MQAYRVATTLTENATLTLSDLPFKAGDLVDVVVLVRSTAAEKSEAHASTATPRDLTEAIAEGEWADSTTAQFLAGYSDRDAVYDQL